MKKTISFLTFAALILLFSCSKSEVEPVAQNESNHTGNLKDLADVPIFVANNIAAGTLLVEDIEGGIMVTALLTNPDWEFLSNHIYVGLDEPSSPSPGQFPYTGVIGPPTMVNFFVSYDDLGDVCGTFYIAFYAEVTNGEDTEGAWAIDSDDPIYWLNPGGNPIGWGAYFAFDVSCGPQITVAATTQDLSLTYGFVRYRNMNINTDPEPEVLVHPDGGLLPPVPINFSSDPDCDGFAHADGHYLFSDQLNHIGFQYAAPFGGLPFGIMHSTIFTNYFYCTQVPIMPPAGLITAIQLVITDRAHDLDLTNIVITNVNINGTDVDGDFSIDFGEGDIRFNFTGDIVMADGGFVFQADLKMNYQVPGGAFDMNFVELKFGQE